MGSIARHSNRKIQVLKRKNFFPTLLITVLLWTFLAGLIYFADPGMFGAVPLFFILTFFTLLFTFSLLLADRRRGLIGSIGITLFLILSYLGVGNILNFILILAIAICIEIYFSWK